MSLPRWLLFCSTALLAVGSAPAQAPPPAGGNLLGNGGFERSTRTVDNLWDGVDGDGNLATPTFSARVITEGSGLGSLAMPASVAVADLNGDGKPDLLVASPTGFYFFYPNQGTPTEPRFTNAELLPLFVSTSAVVKDTYRVYGHERDQDRYCPRICLADWRKRGLLDLMIGNYFGEMLFVPNTGTVRQPVFSQPATIEKAKLQTDDRNRLWANLFSPAAADWNGDGKLDVITGEGTYSANSVRLLENIGGEVPKFTDARRSSIAFGDGRENLIPTVADFNGDGNPDLLVADRTGEIGVYLNPGPAKPGVELKRASTLTFGGTSKLPGLVAPTAADLNGDGLFDLVLGMSNGRIAMALNTGTKEQPAFGAWREIKGEDRLKRNVRVPTDWELQVGAEFGNGLAYWQVVDAQEDPASEPPEGTSCIKAGYWPPLAGAAFTIPESGYPQAIKHFMLIHPLKLQIDKNYALSFKVKGANVEKANWMFHHWEDSVTGSVKMERGERNEGTRTGTRVREEVRITGEIPMTSKWSKVEKTITPRFKDPALKERTEMNGHLVIDFYARGLSSTVYLDDIQVVAQ